MVTGATTPRVLFDDASIDAHRVGARECGRLLLLLHPKKSKDKKFQAIFTKETYGQYL